jgi:hypothetical protein
MYRKKSHFSLWLFSLLLHSSARFIESFLKQLCPRALLIRGSLSALFNGVRRMKSALASKRGTRVIIFALINLQDFFFCFLSFTSSSLALLLSQVTYGSEMSE